MTTYVASTDMDMLLYAMKKGFLPNILQNTEQNQV